MKIFNTASVCNPDLHYVVDTSGAVNKIITEYVDKGKYFTINRARQYGKTTTLYALTTKLSEKYYVIQLNFEWTADLFQSYYDFVVGFIEMMQHEMEYTGVPKYLIEQWSKPVRENLPLKDLGIRITELCKNSDREIVLMIDEVDGASNNEIMKQFLGMLRDKYGQRSMRKDYTFKSVILASVYDIRNLQLRNSPKSDAQNSPWNIAAKFEIDMSLQSKNIAKMLEEYKSDYGLDFDSTWFAEQIYEYTSGYPFLVSRICQLLDTEVAQEVAFGTRQAAWTVLGFQRAIKLLIKENNTLFDDLDKKLEDNAELKEAIYKIVVCRERISLNSRNNLFRLGVMFGWLKEENGWTVISNRIFETVICDKLVQEKMMEDFFNPGVAELNQFVSGELLNVNKIMERFAAHYAELYSEETKAFLEQEARMVFLCFLKPIINGTGNYYIEPEAFDKTRTDIIVDYHGKRYIIELKIWHGESYEQSGREQLAGYLKRYDLSVGWLLSFCFNKNKDKLIGTQTIELDGKIIRETVV